MCEALLVVTRTDVIGCLGLSDVGVMRGKLGVLLV